jgi:NAD(P)-dependent dehydrogenase (short-subunit alcohol dehydrogenase family)
MSVLDRFSLKGKKALIYAPQFEFGPDVAAGLAEAGAQVWLCGEDKAALDKVAADMSAAGSPAAGVKEYHQGTEAAAKALAAFVKEEMGGIDVYVDNGARMHLSGWDHTYQEIFESFKRGQLGVMLTVKNIGEIMVEQKRGSVIFMTDYSALVGCDVHNYKDCPEEFKKDFGLDNGYINGSYVNYARQAAGYLGEAGCRCNTVAFGPKAGTKPASFDEAFIKHSHIRHLAGPEDVKGIAVFLASDASSFITGTTIPVDGGYTAK